MRDFNIISNNCTGARYYEIKDGFTNPFMWNSIKYNDFIYLIEHFEYIDFKNIRGFFTKNEIYREKDMEKIPCLLLDEKIKMYYIHHYFTETHPVQKVFRNEQSEINFNNGIYNRVEYDICGNDVLKYLVDCWNKRLLRMNFNNENIFMYWDSPDYTEGNDIHELFKINGNHKIIVISDEDCTELQDEKHIFFKKENKNTIMMAKTLDLYLKTLKN